MSAHQLIGHFGIPGVADFAFSTRIGYQLWVSAGIGDLAAEIREGLLRIRFIVVAITAPPLAYTRRVGPCAPPAMEAHGEREPLAIRQRPRRPAQRRRPAPHRARVLHRRRERA